MRTPWGMTGDATQTAEGVYEVSTSSHGGMMIHERMTGFLSDAARSIGEVYGEYLCFEEDCAYAAVYAEMPQLWRASVDKGVLITSAETPADSTMEFIAAHYRNIAETWFSEAYGLPCHFCERAKANGAGCYKHSGQLVRGS